MQKIKGNLYSPFQKIITVSELKKGEPFKFITKTKLEWARLDATVNRIRASEGYPVTSFRQLMDEVANVTLSNKNYEMFYRGQKKDYKNNVAKFYQDRKQKTIIFPTICRPEKKENGDLKYSIKQSQILKRYDDLSKMIEYSQVGKNYHNEFYYALFQHYDVLPTPLIDITQSLRVAATFALRENNNSKGYVYVFGLPYPNQSISYFTDLGIVLIKLQNVVPIKAKRPRYQEGFLVGKFPIVAKKTKNDDLANRLVAKFLVDNTKGTFWDKDFQPMPDALLFPENDEIEKNMKDLKEQFEFDLLKKKK